jgi:hypothetical protein
LIYLSRETSEGVINEIYNAVSAQPGVVGQAAAYTLWYISIGGTMLPNPAKYGLSF